MEMRYFLRKILRTKALLSEELNKIYQIALFLVRLNETSLKIKKLVD